MSIIDDKALIDTIATAVRQVVREELARTSRVDEYLSVRDAAAVAGVMAATIRCWIDEGRLARFHAGRHLRIRRSELEAMLAQPPPTDPGPSPEQRALDVFHKRRRRGLPE